MPISRKKNCARCRRSKLSCDRAMPMCSRCAKKQVRCEYTDPEPMRPVTSSQNELLSTQVDLEGTFASLEEASVDPTPLDSSASRLDPTGPLPFEWIGDAPGYSDQTLFAFESASQHPDPSLSNPVQLLPEKGYIELESTLESAMLLDDQDLDPSLDFIGHRAGPAFHRGDSRLVPAGRLSGVRLLKRRRLLEDCVLSAVVIGQLASYPKMLIEGDRLPPFIKAPCHIDQELALDCAASGKHKCLPKSLAICAGLVQMFYARTSANAAFVWEMIYAEAARLRKEASTFTAQEKLEAVQALMIFLLLQADDTRSVETNDVAFLLTSAGKLFYNVAMNEEFREEPMTARPSPREWTFRESVRRLLHIFGIIDLLMEGVYTPSESQCAHGGAFLSAPLPCVRDVWEATSVKTWAGQYDRALATRQSGRLLLTSDLTESRLTSPHYSTNGDEPKAALLDWCKGMDALGTLIWMVIPLQQYRVREEVRDIW